MTITLYGIANCDNVRKARAWLTSQEIAHTFHDFRKDGLDAIQLAAWQQALGWEALLNRRGTTWRQLDARQKDDVVDAASALTLLLDAPAMIKRPVLQTPDGVHLGFSDTQYQTIFGR